FSTGSRSSTTESTPKTANTRAAHVTATKSPATRSGCRGRSEGGMGSLILRTTFRDALLEDRTFRGVALLDPTAARGDREAEPQRGLAREGQHAQQEGARRDDPEKLRGIR